MLSIYLFLDIEDVLDVLVFMLSQRKRLVETERPLKTTTVIPKLGVIKLLYTLKCTFLSMSESLRCVLLKDLDSNVEVIQPPVSEGNASINKQCKKPFSSVSLPVVQSPHSALEAAAGEKTTTRPGFYLTIGALILRSRLNLEPFNPTSLRGHYVAYSSEVLVISTSISIFCCCM